MMTSDNSLQHWQTFLNQFQSSDFQQEEQSGKFPIHFFDALRQANRLNYNIAESNSSFLTFAAIASQMGELDTGSAICWVMHNQQFNSLVYSNAQHLLQSNDLIASVTTQPDASATLNKNNFALQQSMTGYQFERDAPIVSYGQHADKFLITLNKARHKDVHDVWLCLADQSHIQQLTPATQSAVSCRTTANVSIRFAGTLSESQLIAPLNRVMASMFIPIAHLGWAGAYLGATRSVIKKLHLLLRRKKSLRGVNWQDPLLIDRIGDLISRQRACEMILKQAALVCDSALNDKSSDNQLQQQTDLNTLKIYVSEQLLMIRDSLQTLTGSEFSLQVNDALGLERVSRDLQAARLMFHNDKLRQYLFQDWFLYQTGQAL